jgi:hypothetical protein
MKGLLPLAQRPLFFHSHRQYKRKEFLALNKIGFVVDVVPAILYQTPLGAFKFKSLQYAK